jgi:hypothetical protein
MIAKPKESKARTPYLEYCYCEAQRAGAKTLIVSFPGRKGNRPAAVPADQCPPFLKGILDSSDADVLYVRSVYEGDYNLANITDDHYLLPEFLYDLREQRDIKRLVLFGFSLGCEPCIRLARKYVADEVILISPALCSVETLNAVEDNRLQKDFDKFCNTWNLPEIEPFPQNIRVKILQGLNLENDLLKERPLVYYLKLLIPQAIVEVVPGTGHHIINFWRDQGILKTKIHDLLGIEPTTPVENPRLKWTNLADAFTRDIFAESETPAIKDIRVTA